MQLCAMKNYPAKLLLHRSREGDFKIFSHKSKGHHVA
jgi:hypothetical protein